MRALLALISIPLLILAKLCGLACVVLLVAAIVLMLAPQLSVMTASAVFWIGVKAAVGALVSAIAGGACIGLASS